MNDREFLRHTLATLAYRAAKVLRDAPPALAAYKPGPSSRTAEEILAHMGDLFDWGLSMAVGKPAWQTSTPLEWEAECRRFFAAVKAFDDALASDRPLSYETTKLFQGPVADALCHAGQIGMPRRLLGAPVKGESYNLAAIQIGQVGADQAPPDPRYEFD